MKGTFSRSSHRTERRLAQESEHLVDQPRPVAGDADGAARLREVLAREPRGDQIDRRQAIDIAHVADEGNVGEASAKDRHRRRLDLAQELGVVPCAGEPELDPADAGEQPGDSKRMGVSGLRAPRRCPLHAGRIMAGGVAAGIVAGPLGWGTRHRLG